MINLKPAKSFKSVLPVICASVITIAGCSGEQIGDTNAGLAGGLSGGVSGTTVLGVAGGVLLAGVLLSSDDDDAAGDSVVGGEGDSGDGGTDDGTGGGADDGTGGGADDGTGGGTDDGTGGGTDDGTGGGTDDGTGGGTDDGTGGGTDDGTGGGTDDGTGGGTDDGTGGGGVVLSDSGAVDTQLLASEAVPGNSSTGIGTANLIFNRSTGDVSGTVTLSGITATEVNIMVGPPGSNGFVAVALEMTGPGEWSVPDTLSAEQQAFVLQNLNSGNLYIAAVTPAYPNGEIRRQLTPAGVSLYTATDTSDDGGTAEGYIVINENTGDYSITWNTSDATLSSAHINDGVVSGSTENNYAPLTQRPSNPAWFFLDGDYTDPADPLYPDLLQRLIDGNVFLDAHAADDTRVFFTDALTLQ